MLLNEPGRTDYDLTFNLFGFEVRTHPAFFIMPILLGRGFLSAFQNSVNTGVGWLVLIAVFWLSVLIHELGHTFAFRFYGIHSRIVLYWMGGLAIPDGANVWRSRRSNSLRPGQQIVVSLAGPVAGLLLSGVLCLLVYSLGGKIGFGSFLFPIPLPDFEGAVVPTAGVVALIFWSGILLNFLMNLFNLVPIFPLDGGQIARQIMIQADPREGLRNSIFLSLAACVGMILLCLKFGNEFGAIFFGFMAFSNYQSLQGFGGSRW